MNAADELVRERLRGIRLRVYARDARRQLDLVEHKTFAESLDKYWRQDGSGRGTPESICWLFCWAHNGMGRRRTRDHCRALFNEIIEIGYASFEHDIGYDFARRHRYNDPWKPDL